MNKIQNLRNELNRLKDLSKLDLTLWNPKTLGQMEGLQKNAIQEIPKVLENLAKEILQDSITIQITDSCNFRHDLINSLQNEQGDNVISLDFYELEKTLLSKCITNVKKDLYNIDIDFVYRVNNLLPTLLKTNNIKTIYPENKFLCGATGLDNAAKKTEELLKHHFGNEVKALFIKNSLETAISEKSEYDKVIIILKNMDPNNIDNIIVTNKQITISTEKLENSIILNEKTTLQQLLNNIKKQLKNSGS